MPKTKEKKQPFPIYPIEAWSVEKYGVKLYINPDWGINFYDGMALDVEDDEQGNLVGIGIYDPKLNVCYYWNEPWQSRLVPKFVAHNGISDLRKLHKWGFNVTDEHLMWDTMIIGHLIDSSLRSYGLKDMSVRDLGIDQPKYEDITGKIGSNKHVTLRDIPLELTAQYNAIQCYTTYMLYKKQYSQIKATNQELKLYETLEAPAAKIFNKMEAKGLKLDLGYLTTLKDTLEAQISAVKQPILNELGNINLESPKQVLSALSTKGINPTFKKKPSTDKRGTLYTKWGNEPLVKNLSKYSELESLLSGFVYPYLERNQEEIHPHFSQVGTRTGRPSCANPNLLNIPKRTENGRLVRKMFIARPGRMFGCADYKEGEPRLLAHLSKDKDMCALFNEGRGFHSYFAERLNISREKAKIFDLETYYRATKFGVARTLNCSLTEAQKWIDAAWNLFPGLWDWEQKVIYEAKKNGYITTLMGRRIRIEGLDNPNEWRRSEAERQVMNNLAQGSLQECTKIAMIEIDKAGIEILVQVYDDLLIESYEHNISHDIQIVVDKMQNSTKLCIPMIADSKSGYSWGEMH